MMIRIPVAAAFGLALASPAAAQVAAAPTGAPAGTMPVKQSIDIFGQTIRYVDVGSGPVIVLLHGTGGSAEAWEKQIPALSRHYRVIALDQIGWGESAHPLVGYRIQTWVDFLGEFLRVKKIDRFALGGLSLGGWIAASYAVQSLDAANTGPYRLPPPDRLVLVDGVGIQLPTPTPIAPPNGRTPMQDPTSIANTVQGLRGAYHDPKYATVENARKYLIAKLKAGNGATLQSWMVNMKAGGETLDAAQLAKITIPTLVIWGDDDHIVPIANGRAFVAAVPGAKMVVIKDSGHVVPTEQPDAFLKALEDFLATKPSK